MVWKVCEVNPLLGPECADATGKDISLGGIGIETHRHYPVGSALVLELLLPEPEEHALPQSPQKKGVFHVQGQVIWSHHLEGGRFATGLRFVAMDERQVKTLSQLIAEENQ